MARIAIVTPGQVGSNPRVVKEADALVEAGHDVTVIATRVLDEVEPRDEAILCEAKWRCQRIDLRGAYPRQLWRMTQAAAAITHRLTGAGADQAYSLFTHALTPALAHHHADLYIAHYTAALPAAAAAAQRRGARLAYDAEDFHPGDDPDGPAFAQRRRIIEQIEAKYLPRCAYVSAASPGIAEAYARRYGIAVPIVILNLFPLRQAPPSATAAGVVRPGPSVYWFSQTIGPDRGLECAVAAIAKARSGPHFYLRGHTAWGYKEQLEEAAASLGVADRLHWLDPAIPSEMERLAGAYDLGLASETGHTEARRLALTNKLFTYLLAGTPILLSATPGQAAMAPALGEAAALFAIDDADDLAAKIDAYLLEPAQLAAARAKAFALGQSRFNWDIEKKTLAATVERALVSP